MDSTMLKIPTFGHVLYQLDGRLPGLNLYDIVTSVPWRHSASESHPNDSYITWVFRTRLTAFVELSYHYRFFEEHTDQLPVHHELRMKTFEDLFGSKNALEHRFWMSHPTQQVRIQGAVHRGELFERVYGYPHPFHFDPVTTFDWNDFYNWHMQTAERKQTMLRTQDKHQIFCALMTLAASVKPDGSSAFELIRYRSEASRVLAEKVRKTFWGD